MVGQFSHLRRAGVIGHILANVDAQMIGVGLTLLTLFCGRGCLKSVHDDHGLIIFSLTTDN